MSARILRVGRTAYVESAQACGLPLLDGRPASSATTRGVGELLLAAREAGATRVVVGLGGSGSNDGGAGLLAALGAGGDRPLDRGVAGLEGIGAVMLPDQLGLEIVAASDVDNPLTGLHGATRVFGPQKGLPDEELPRWDAVLEAYAAATDRRIAIAPGAGAAGGLGHALLLLGAQRRSGFDVIAEAVGLAERTRRADLVITGEGSFDPSTAGGKVPAGVAAVAAEAICPCIVLAGRVGVGAREMRALGIESAYALLDTVGEERALGAAYDSLAELAARVARTWSH